MIGKLIEHAKNGYAVVKGNDEFLVIAKNIPDFLFKTDYAFGNYKGVRITKPLFLNFEEVPKEVPKIVSKIPMKTIQENWIKIFQEETARFDRLKALDAYPLEKIAKELTVELKKYGLRKFINRHEGYNRALIAGAIEIALKESIQLKGDIKVGVLKIPTNVAIKFLILPFFKDITKEQREKLKSIKPDEFVDYVPLTPQSKTTIKVMQMGLKEIKEGKTDRAKETLKSMGGKFLEALRENFHLADIESVNVNTVKEKIKKKTSINQAWLCLLTAWCDAKEKMFKASSKALDTVAINTRGKGLDKPYELFDLDNIDDGKIGYINKIENRKLSTHELTAFYDVLLRLYAQGTLKDKYILVDGKASRKSLTLVKKNGYPLITSQTIKKLINGNKKLVVDVKKALKNIGQIEWKKEGFLNDKGKRKKVVFSIKPIHEKRAIEIENGGKFYLFEIEKELFEYEIEKEKRTFGTVESESFARISRAKANSKAKNDASQLLVVLYQQAGSKRSGDRTTFISYNFFGDMEAQHRKRSRERVRRALELLKEIGNIESYKDYKGKFLVNLGG